MELAVGIVMAASALTFIFGLGQAAATNGDEYIIAIVSAIVMLACTLWAWGFSCGQTDTEDKEEEKVDWVLDENQQHVLRRKPRVSRPSDLSDPQMGEGPHG
ncbi:MAG: hypothetical protein GQ524_11680 [Anaerolineales bacterium]|nr:hypothetical protein [Anaerolineales bacterium]